MATGTAGSTARQYHTSQVHYMYRDITIADAGNTLDIGEVPAGATIDDAYVIVSTVFNAGTNNRLDIGTEDDTDDFATDLSLLTAGKIAADELATADNLGPFATNKTIQCVVDVTGTAATTGVARVVVKYIVDNWS